MSDLIHSDDDLSVSAFSDTAAQSRLQVAGIRQIAQLAADFLNFDHVGVCILDGKARYHLAAHGVITQDASEMDELCVSAFENPGLLVLENHDQISETAVQKRIKTKLDIQFFAAHSCSVEDGKLKAVLFAANREEMAFSEQQRSYFCQIADLLGGQLRALVDALRLEAKIKANLSKTSVDSDHLYLLEKSASVSGIGGWKLIFGENPVWTDETCHIHDVPVGYSPSLEKAIEFYAPSARPKIAKAVEDGIKHGKAWDMELPLITAKGRKIWARACGEPIYENEKVIGLIGTFQDITEQKDNEARLKSSERESRRWSRELKTILAHMNQGVSVFDRKGELTVWNDRYLEIFQKNPRKIKRGTSFRSILEEEHARGEYGGDIDADINTLMEAMKRGDILRNEFELKDGTIISSVHAPMPGGGWVGTHEDVTARETASRRIEHAANHDPLTGLANRARFEEFIQDRIPQMRNDDCTIALMLIDLDGFKAVNDTHGHKVGDALLKIVSRRLQGIVRTEDLVARLGGDEFAVVLRIDDAVTLRVEDVAKRIVTDLQNPMAIEGLQITISASVGISLLIDTEDPLDTALVNADNALYHVKGQGKADYHIFDGQADHKQNLRARQEKALIQAVRDEKFKLLYQPIYSMSDTAIVGYEALLRIESDDFEMTAGQFIPMAIELGLINQMGDWVLDQALAHAADWPTDMRLAINIAAQQLGSGEFYKRLSDTIDRYGIDPERLDLEIIETTLLKNDAAINEELMRLKALGAKIVLDDFGTGYSSLSSLTLLPVDRIKIDQSVIDGFEHDQDRANMVVAISGISQALKINMMIEGVETYEQFQLLKLMNCSHVQGFYFSEPLEEEKLTHNRPVNVVPFASYSGN